MIHNIDSLMFKEPGHIEILVWDEEENCPMNLGCTGSGCMVGVNNVLMQYTGLKDKNGKEIYEGDIVREGADPVVVKWDEQNARFFYTTRTASVGLYGFVGEVMGNIWEHPELLKEESHDKPTQ